MIHPRLHPSGLCAIDISDKEVSIESTRRYCDDIDNAWRTIVRNSLYFSFGNTEKIGGSMTLIPEYIVVHGINKIEISGFAKENDYFEEKTIKFRPMYHTDEFIILKASIYISKSANNTENVDMFIFTNDFSKGKSSVHLVHRCNAHNGS